ncbi:DEP domain-containing protein 7-like [Thalassophryne amazonica]|uniref:DEP domain-containing protein 7-like n=1 Tax=Thalassophryne amazonica TaxID=390379 RepID=UPI0014718EA3|nr:DEP domain-containing protein 7-like [Thalassophryne amazonica]
MTSIKERAEALNLAEKLFVRPQAHGVASKPVHSVSLWSALIARLKSSVTVKRRRVHLKSHSDCFLGSEAVDVVTDHIIHLKGFEGADVSRDKVVLVCQALLDCGMFEAVGAKVFLKVKKQNVFQDSKNALYRFASTCTPSVDELEKGALVHGIQKFFCSGPSDSPEEETFPSGSQAQKVTPAKVPQTLKTDTPGSTGRTPEGLVDGLSLSPSRVEADPVLPQSLVDEVWQEQTILRLLNLVELPLLDEVLQYIHTLSPSSSLLLVQTNPDLLYSSNHLDRQILKAFRDSQEDEWLCAALDCLDFLPDQPVVELSRELPHCFPKEQEGSRYVLTGSRATDGIQLLSYMSTPDGFFDDQVKISVSVLSRCKLLLYEMLVKHYGHADRAALLPQQLTDIYTAVTDLLVNAKLSTALEALQLCLKLLPPRCRDELHRLLRFMSLAADPQGVKLDKEMENRLAVKKSFTRAILHSKTLPKEKAELLVVFMLSNIQEIFKIPGALHKRVSDKLASLAQGTQPDVTSSTFCQQMSSRTYTDAASETTTNELSALLRSIHLDPKISAKEKQRLLGQFYQMHPEVFNQYFGDAAVSVL